MILSCPYCRGRLETYSADATIEKECPRCFRSFTSANHSSGSGNPHEAPPLTDRVLARLAMLMSCYFTLAVFLVPFALSLACGNRLSILSFAGLICFTAGLSILLTYNLACLVFQECTATGSRYRGLYWRRRFLRTLGFAGIKHLRFGELWVYCSECKTGGIVSISLAGQIVMCDCGHEVRVGTALLERFFFCIQRMPPTVIRVGHGIGSGLAKSSNWLATRFTLAVYRLVNVHKWGLHYLEIVSLRQYEWSGAVLHKYLEINHGVITSDNLCRLFKRPADETETLQKLAEDYLRIMNIDFTREGDRLIVDELLLHNVRLDGFADNDYGTQTSRLTW